MGDFFQTIVDRDVSLAEAEGAAARVIMWMIAQEMILPTPFEGAGYDGDTRGYLPGLNIASAIDVLAGGAREMIEDAQAVSNGQLELDVFLSTGMQIEVGRRFFCDGQGGMSVFCPACKACVYRSHRPDLEQLVPREVFWAAVADWEQGGSGTLTCPVCYADKLISEWDFDPLFAFGNLGFTFWNWPMLKNEFITEVGNQLGHRVTFLPRRKL